MNTRKTGIIKSFNNAKGKGSGFGFISVPGERDMFVHIREVRGATDSDRQLFAGDEVSYEIGEGPDGRPCARNVIVQLRAAAPVLKYTHD
jgi:cold shock CspA family protein